MENLLSLSHFKQKLPIHLISLIFKNLPDNLTFLLSLSNDTLISSISSFHVSNNLFIHHNYNFKKNIPYTPISPINGLNDLLTANENSLLNKNHNKNKLILNLLDFLNLSPFNKDLLTHSNSIHFKLFILNNSDLTLFQNLINFIISILIKYTNNLHSNQNLYSNQNQNDNHNNNNNNNNNNNKFILKNFNFLIITGNEISLSSHQKINLLLSSLLKNSSFNTFFNFNISKSDWNSTLLPSQNHSSYKLLSLSSKNNFVNCNTFEHPQNLENLKKFNNLNFLNLSSNKISSSSIFTSLNSLQSLTWLDLSNNNFLNLNNISSCLNLLNLKYLSLASNNTFQIHPNFIQNLFNLQSLNLSNNNLSQLDSSFFSNNLSLKTLNLSNNNLTKINYLNHLSQLTTLDLSNNKISSIFKNSFSHLINLSHLDLSHNRIEFINGLKPLNNLRSLNLSNNYIDKIQNLSDLSVLSDLDLSSNRISRIQNINHLLNLNYLRLGYNTNIKKIEGLNHLSNLHHLNLIGVQIVDIDNQILQSDSPLNFSIVMSSPTYIQLEDESKIKQMKSSKMSFTYLMFYFNF
ncbi:L domain-like protein [Ascoidea rubescens DSM 1968]|uniref:L domain-like protein n=1 Tax=Ascoidea rubescens DSM 1968 TaxID=1344418 RepID=A0A1D2VS90_9ASCO|nr:L domain-like protein [Ascoidea rubescens DSM 1968]ODV64473.1 L domain-like protein [Ascoidea rubescens DSM 1968]